MPDTDTPRLGPRPSPKERTRSPYYKASLALAILFMGLALSLPFWLDKVRQPVDRAVLGREMVAPTTTTLPATMVPTAPPSTAPQPGGAVPAAATGAINANCRAYVFARCNALRIDANECLPIALEAVRVPVESDLTQCRAAVEDSLVEAGKTAAARLEATEGPAARPDRVVGDGEADPGPAGGDTAPGAAVPGAAVPGAAAPAAGTEPATVTPEEAQAAAAAQAASTKELPPAQRAEKLEKVLKTLEELQRGANNYATLPAAQNARLSEIRGLVEEVGNDDAKKIYNQLVERYRARPAPDSGSPYKESPRVEAGISGNAAPSTTPEMDQVRGMVNDARRQAGLPPTPPPDPNAALRAPSPDEAAAPAAVELRP